MAHTPQASASNTHRPNDRSAAGGLREGTKQATLIALLKQAHPKGITLDWRYEAWGAFIGELTPGTTAREMNEMEFA